MRLSISRMVQLAYADFGNQGIEQISAAQR